VANQLGAYDVSANVPRHQLSCTNLENGSAAHLQYAIDTDPRRMLTLIRAMCMALERNSRPRLVCVLLMGHAQLVVADDLVVRDLLPLAGALEMLRHESRVPEDLGVRDHCHEFFGRHGFPYLVEEGAVVDTEGGCDACSETRPVLFVQESSSVSLAGAFKSCKRVQD
jgi:hypothetical protein